VVSIEEAKLAAQKASAELSQTLDLVEISPGSEPPVCRIMDYGKFVFEQRKKQASARKKQKQVQVKEIKLRPGTEEGDFQVKLRSILRFLEDGDKIKITMRFRGREIVHHELGLALMKRIEVAIEENGMIEQQAKLEGKQMLMVVGPKKK